MLYSMRVNQGTQIKHRQVFASDGRLCRRNRITYSHADNGHAAINRYEAQGKPPITRLYRLIPAYFGIKSKTFFLFSKVALTLLTLFCVLPLPARGEEAKRPNILFALADDWGYGHAGAYGCPWVKTPAFDRVAQQGLLFTHAFTPNAKCAPSRACILTGRNSWQLEAAANHWCYFPLKFKTVFEELRDQGYFIGYTAKGWAPGIATNADGGQRWLTGPLFEQRKEQPLTTAMKKVDYAANFADFLDAAPKDKPFCFWYGSHDPHRPYESHSGVKKGGKKLSDIDRVPACLPDNDVTRNDMLDYAIAVERYDQHLGRMLAELEKRGLLENTIVVATSDNGMSFPHLKGQEYEFSNRLPLAIMWPARLRKPGRVVDDFVSFIDFAPTFIELAGLKPGQTGMAPMTGRSLTDILFSEKSGQINSARDHVLIGKERHDIGRPQDWGYPIRGIVEGDMLYLHNFETNRWPVGNPETGYLNCDSGPTKTFILKAHRANPDDYYWALDFGKRVSDELYNVKTDADCVHNLSADAGEATTQQRLHDQLFKELKDQEDPRMFGHGDVFDKYPFADESRRNFYERYMSGEKIMSGNRGDYEKKPLPDVQ
jgi:N-sulfoglucosamine sulfohydrolase